MPCLHILNKAPGHPRTGDCQAQLAEGDQLLLIESAVLAVADPAWLEKLPSGVRVLGLLADSDARGLTKCFGDRVQAIDYAGFVDLAAAAENIQHW